MNNNKKNGSRNKKSHALFWILLKDVPGYKDSIKEDIKEILVEQYSKGRTTSLSEMFRRYPQCYMEMIEYMKSFRNRERYDKELDMWRKRVIAVICKTVDDLYYRFPSTEYKIRYVKAVAMRAANSSSFNAIPKSKLQGIYNKFLKSNEVGDVPVELRGFFVN